MRNRRPLLALAALLFLAPAPPEAATPDDAKALKGIWAARSITVDGRRLPDDPTKGPIMIAFDGTSYVQRQGVTVTEEGTYQLRPSGSPDAIDFVIERPAGNGRQLGVYNLSGDTLTLCVAPPGSTSRPKEIGAKSNVVIVLKRYRP
jgi:uncharacterized protein (TIGR03067 family)